jgi:hypothetical protein
MVFVAVREAGCGPSRHFAAAQQSVALGGKATVAGARQKRARRAISAKDS